MSSSRIIAIAATTVALAGCKISSATFIGGDDDDMHADATTVGSHDITLRLFDDLTLTGSTHNGDLVGFHDGDGPWQTAPGQDGVYHLHLGSDHYGVAVGCITMVSTTQIKQMSITESAVADRSTLDLVRCITSPPVVHISGHVSGIASSDYVMIFGNAGAGFVLGSGNGDFTMTTAPGTTDLFATRVDTSTNQTLGLIHKTNLDLQEGSSINFDFSSEAEVIVTSMFTTNDTSGFVQTVIKTPTGLFSMGNSSGSSSAPPTQYQVLAGALPADELYIVTFSGSMGRSASKVTTGGPLEVDVGEPIAVTPPSVSNDPYPRPTWTLPIGASTLPIVSYSVGASYAVASPSVVTSWGAQLTEAWRQAADVTTYTLPDLSSIDGFAAMGYALPPHVDISSNVSRSEATKSDFSTGFESRSASQFDTIANP